VESDEPDEPLHREALGVERVVLATEHRSDFIEELGWLTSCRVRHRGFPSWRPASADNGHWAKLPENPANIALSGKNGKIING
jgi:hypothetical protein